MAAPAAAALAEKADFSPHFPVQAWENAVARRVAVANSDPDEIDSDVKYDRLLDAFLSAAPRDAPMVDTLARLECNRAMYGGDEGMLDGSICHDLLSDEEPGTPEWHALIERLSDAELRDTLEELHVPRGRGGGLWRDPNEIRISQGIDAEIRRRREFAEAKQMRASVAGSGLSRFLASNDPRTGRQGDRDVGALVGQFASAHITGRRPIHGEPVRDWRPQSHQERLIEIQQNAAAAAAAAQHNPAGAPAALARVASQLSDLAKSMQPPEKRARR